MQKKKVEEKNLKRSEYIMTKEQKIKELKKYSYPAIYNYHLYPWNKLGFMPKGIVGLTHGWQWYSDCSLLNIIDEKIIDDALKLLNEYNKETIKE